MALRLFYRLINSQELIVLDVLGPNRTNSGRILNSVKMVRNM